MNQEDKIPSTTENWENGKLGQSIEHVKAVEDDNDFPLGKACDLSGEGTCDSCQ